MTINNQQGTKIIALGTGGGPIVSSSRAGISTAICVPILYFLIKRILLTSHFID